MLETTNSFEPPIQERDAAKLEGVQSTCILQVLGQVTDEEKLRELAWRKSQIFQARLVGVCQYLQGMLGWHSQAFFTGVWQGDETSGGYELKQEVPTGYKETPFPVRVVEHWNRFAALVHLASDPVWARGWTRDLLRSVPSWLSLLFW